MSNPILPSLRLDEADDQIDSPLSRIVESHLNVRGRNLDPNRVDLVSCWDAAFYGLNRVKLFNEATKEEQATILAGCARHVINEAYFIEKSGAAYCAKMILLAQSTEMRQVYSLIAADEATHLQWIRPYVEPVERSQPGGELLHFLSQLIEECSINSLAFLVQIILEGWGLNHYRSLSQHCLHAPLKSVFHSIYKDEALHHHTGEVIFDPSRVVSAQEKTLIRDSLRTYTELVRVGPQGVVGVLDRVMGGLNPKQTELAFAELDTEAQSREKLVFLRDLMLGPGRESYVADLDEKAAFAPYPPKQCAAVFQGTRGDTKSRY